MTLKLLSLTTSAGFLQHAPIPFAPELTCVIGARGTCKSTVIETLRFVFNCDSKRVEQLCVSSDLAIIADTPSTRGLIRATLQGGVAKCSVERTTGECTDSFTIERETESLPRVFHNGFEELIDKSILQEIEIYSQGDLQRIAEDERRRLELIDRPNKKRLDALHRDRSDIARELRALGPKIREKATEIEARKADLRSLETLKSQLAVLQAQRPQLSEELDAQRNAALKRKSILETIGKAITEKETFCGLIQNALSTSTPVVDFASSLQELGIPAAEIIASTLERLNLFRATLARDLESLVSENLGTCLREIERHFDQQNIRYRQLRQEQQEVNESLKREDTIKQQISSLEKLQCELEQFTEAQAGFVKERSTLRVRITELNDQIYTLRQQEVDNINSRHNAVIVLTLTPGAYTTEYASSLMNLLQGSRIRSQDDVAKDISLKIRPCDLIDIIESGDSKRIANLLDRDISQMGRLVSYLLDRPALYELEGIVFEDHLEITLYDKAVPKPINQLSKGQMATALLPLILRPAPYPLIFDQPEDDLDNSFIYKTLVVQIQELKKQRQLIFVTHNANIPVLGEADTVIVMEMQAPTQAKAPAVGSVDGVKSHILDLLEGGSDAFRRRHQKYDSLL